MADLVSHPDEVKGRLPALGQGALTSTANLELDGYQALQKALAMEPDAIINEVKASGLRGAAEPILYGMKWSFVPKRRPAEVRPVQWDESEPGTCKDRLIFEPIRMRDRGVMIGALAWARAAGTIYIRGEYRYLLVIMQKRPRAYAKDYWEKHFRQRARLGHYWHGAQSLRSRRRVGADGVARSKRGIPRIRPPFPAVVGSGAAHGHQ